MGAYTFFSQTDHILRVRPKINLHFQVLRRPHGKAREGRTGYLTDEQRSHAGWIGASKCEVIFGRALRQDNRINKICVQVDRVKAEGKIWGCVAIHAFANENYMIFC